MEVENYNTSREVCKDEAETKKGVPTFDKTEVILKFADYIVDILGKVPNLRETLMNKHLGAENKNREKIVFEVPCYKKNIAIFAVNKYIQSKCKINQIIDFCNEGREYYSPFYKNIEVKRGETETLFGHIIFLSLSTRISAAVPGIESNPAFFNSFNVFSIVSLFSFDI